MWSCDDFATTRFAPKFCRKAAEHIGVPVEQILLLDDNYATGKTAKTDEMLTVYSKSISCRVFKSLQIIGGIELLTMASIHQPAANGKAIWQSGLSQF